MTKFLTVPKSGMYYDSSCIHLNVKTHKKALSLTVRPGGIMGIPVLHMVNDGNCM